MKLIHIGNRKIQLLGRIALFKIEIEKHELKEGEIVDVFIRKNK